jgi:hypothetical protein
MIGAKVSHADCFSARLRSMGSGREALPVMLSLPIMLEVPGKAGIHLE